MLSYSLGILTFQAHLYSTILFDLFFKEPCYDRRPRFLYNREGIALESPRLNLGL